VLPSLTCPVCYCIALTITINYNILLIVIVLEQIIMIMDIFLTQIVTELRNRRGGFDWMKHVTTSLPTVFIVQHQL